MAKAKAKKKLVGGNRGAWAHAKEQARGKKNPDAYAAKVYAAITKKSWDAFAARVQLAKTEGTRGGHVIGHTRSGKPIYAHDHVSYSSIHSSKNGNSGGVLHPNAAGPAAKRAHPSYSAEDHHDASVAHEKHWALSGTRGDEGMAMSRITDAHHRAWARGLKKSQGEGSRGGHIIGHTRSGKPIYSVGAGRKITAHGYSLPDHHDARNLHSDLGAKQYEKGDKQGASDSFEAASFHTKAAAKLFKKGVDPMKKSAAEVLEDYLLKSEHGDHKDADRDHFATMRGAAAAGNMFERHQVIDPERKL